MLKTFKKILSKVYKEINYFKDMKNFKLSKITIFVCLSFNLIWLIIFQTTFHLVMFITILIFYILQQKNKEVYQILEKETNLN